MKSTWKPLNFTYKSLFNILFRKLKISHELISHRIKIYNGHVFISHLIRPEMVAFSFGNFCRTTTVNRSKKTIRNNKKKNLITNKKIERKYVVSKLSTQIEKIKAIRRNRLSNTRLFNL